MSSGFSCATILDYPITHSFDRHSGFHFEINMNNAVMNICVFLCSFLLSIYLGVEFLDYMVTLHLIFEEQSYCLPQKGTTLHCQEAIYEGSNFSTLLLFSLLPTYPLYFSSTSPSSSFFFTSSFLSSSPFFLFFLLFTFLFFLFLPS